MLQEATDIGTGNSNVPLPQYIMHHYNNVEITPGEARKFMDDIGFQEVSIRFYPANKVRYGRCEYSMKGYPRPRIFIYRPSVWLFIHELAHAVMLITYGINIIPHGRTFGWTAAMLLERWCQWAPNNTHTYRRMYR